VNAQELFHFYICMQIQYKKLFCTVATELQN